MTRFLRGVLFTWLLICPLLVVRLYAVRNSGIYLGVALLAALLLLTAIEVLRRPALLPWRSRLTVPLLAVGAAAVVAGVQGAIFYDRSVFGAHRFVLVQIYAVALILLSAGAAFAVAALLRSRDDLRHLRWILIAVTVPLLASGWLYHIPKIGWWPLIATHAVSMVLAAVLFEPLSWPTRLAGLAFAAVVLLDVIIIAFVGNVRSQWLSGWVALGIPPALLLLCRFPRTVVLTSIPVAAVGAWWTFDLLQRVVHLSYAEGDFGRLQLWEDAVRMSLQRPMFGIGPGNYLDYIIRYGEIGSVMSSPHGNYQQIAAEMGLVGLGFVLWLMYRSLTLGWRIFRSSSDPFLRSLALAAACSLAGQYVAAFLGDFLLPSYHNGGYWTISATIYAFVVIGALMSAERLAE